MPTYDYKPAVATHSSIFRQNRGQDPAMSLVPDGNLFHKRPYLQSGDLVFVWPVGTEGLRHSGNATLATHRYIGDDDVDVQVIHRDEARIEMTGTFPGIDGINSVQALKILMRDVTPATGGKILFLPGIFERVQYVVIETYDFNHSGDDRTHSWDYTISFLRTGKGKRIADPHGKPAPPNPTRRTKPKGKTARYMGVKAGRQTLRQIAKKVYGSETKWTHLADLNITLIDAIPSHQVPTYRWPLGTKIYY